MAKRTQYYSEAANKGNTRGTGAASSPGLRGPDAPAHQAKGARPGLTEDEIE